MLTPEYLADVPESMVQLYAQVEADILADMAQRLKAYDYWIPASEHQRRVLLEMGASEQEILKKLSTITGKSTAELKKLMLDAGQQALAADNAIYQEQGLQPPPLRASKPMQQVLNAGYARTAKLFRNLTRTTAHTASGQLEQALDAAYMKVTSGAFDYNTAITHAIKSLAKQGLGAVRYPSGRVDTLETAVRRAVMTGVNQTALQLQMTLADELGSDLVEVTAHAGARPSHAVWQGQIYSRSGKSRSYPDFVQATGYGTGAGLGGWNCRHSFYPYFEGTSRTYSKELLDSYQAQNYTYNGRKMTEYEASQMQRGIERQIRRWKRENAAMQAAGLDSTESAVKLRAWQEKQKDFLRQTGLKRQTARERVSLSSGTFSVSESGITNKKIQKQENFRVDFSKVNSNEYIKKFRGITKNPTTDESLCKYARAALTHRDGTSGEDLYIVSAKNGKILGKNTTSKLEFGVQPNKSIIEAVTNHQGDLIGIHTHPDATPPTGSDFAVSYARGYEIGIAACANGSIYVYRHSATYVSQRLIDDTIEKYRHMLDKDGKKAYHSDIEAHLAALNQLVKEYGIYFEKR